MLVQAKLPSLMMLQLAECQLTASAMMQLCKCKWPCLMILNLRANMLDNAAMFSLAMSDWPLLCKLLLHQNPISGVGVRMLAVGKWPKLMYLTFDESIISITASDVLNLTPMSLWKRTQHTTIALRTVTAHHDLVWRSLAGLVIYDDTSSAAMLHVTQHKLSLRTMILMWTCTCFSFLATLNRVAKLRDQRSSRLFADSKNL